MNFYSEDMTGKFSDLEQVQPNYVNALGEPFFIIKGEIIKYSPESGEREVVGSAKNFDPIKLDDYWTAKPLLEEWEQNNGHLEEGKILIPKIPFVLGGDYSHENLAAVSTLDGLDFYLDLRRQIKDLKDGETIVLKVID